jgi:hypothetical protein
MKDEDCIEYLSNLPVERLVAVFRQVLAVKVPAPEEAAFCRSRFYLGAAWSSFESDDGASQRWGSWELDAVAYVDSREYGDEFGPNDGLCQEGSCQSCGTRVRSNVKHGICPICEGPAYMT